MRVVIAEDSVLLREGLARVLTEGDFEVVAQAANATPTMMGLVAAGMGISILPESLKRLSLDGLKKACGEGDKIAYCSACYTGKYPTDIIDVDEIQPAAVRR